MTAREIRLFGDPVLRSAGDPVRIGARGNPSIVVDLLDTVRLPGRAGVAANQIGVTLRAFSWNIEGEVGYVLNPALVEVRGEPEEIEEGCLSVPGVGYPRRRHPWARVEGVDLAGEPVVLEGDGLLAQVLQHECDHLDGHLYIEGLAPEVKREAMRQIRAQTWYRRS